MLTRDEALAHLTVAAELIDAGKTPLDHPQDFLDTLWHQIHDDVAPQHQEEMAARLMDFAARLGLLDPGHHDGPFPRRFRYHYSNQFLAVLVGQLETEVAAMLQAYACEGDFWEAFASEADDLRDRIDPEQHELVDDLIDVMLERVGLRPREL